MKLVTVSKAITEGILREGQIVNLTKLYSVEEFKREAGWYPPESGAQCIQKIKPLQLKWIIAWNDAVQGWVLVGIPIKELNVKLAGKNGFINGQWIMDATVNTLYANDAIGIYGRQITETDYYGLIGSTYGRELKKTIFSSSFIKKSFTSTPFTQSIFEKGTYNQFTKYGFKKLNHNTMNLTDPDLVPDCLYSTVSTLNEEGKLIFEKSEKSIETPLIPILYGKINELLVDVSDLSQGKTGWILYPPETKNVNGDS